MCLSESTRSRITTIKRTSLPSHCYLESVYIHRGVHGENQGIIGDIAELNDDFSVWFNNLIFGFIFVFIKHEPQIVICFVHRIRQTIVRIYGCVSPLQFIVCVKNSVARTAHAYLRAV